MMHNRVSQFVKGYLEDAQIFNLDPAHFLYIDANNGQIDGNCFLYFHQGENHPAIIAKYTETPIGTQICLHEYQNLLILQKHGMNSDGQRCPQPLKIEKKNGYVMTLQSGLPGIILKNRSGKKSFGKSKIKTTIDSLISWWRRCQTCFPPKSVSLTGQCFDFYVSTPLNQLEDRFYLDNQEKLFLRNQLENNEELTNCQLPLMIRHGDLATANICINAHGLMSVFDWETPLHHHLPFFDLFYFFSSLRYPYNVRGGESSHFESFRHVFMQDNYLNSIVNETFQQLCGEFKIPIKILPSLLLLAIIHTANEKFTAFAQALDSQALCHNSFSAKEKAEFWHKMRHQNSDIPFVQIEGGIVRILRLLSQKGLPGF